MNLIKLSRILWLFLALPCLAQSSRTSMGRTIVDQAGDTVRLPARIERVVITSIWPLPSVFCLVDGSGRRLVGMHPASLSAAKHSMLAKTTPEALKASTGFMRGTTINVEELIKLKPDIVLYSISNPGERETLRRAGLKGVGFSTSGADYNALDRVVSWMDLLGEILGKQTRAAEIKHFGYGVKASIQARLAGIPNAKKPRALILYRHSSREIQVSGSRFFGDFWLGSTGAVNAAASLIANQKVNMEQIYAWNPDIIYITNFTPSMPQDFYTNAIPGQDWSKVKAVRNRSVYKIPLGHYRWFPPSSDAPLMLLWMASHNQPDRFRDLRFEQSLKDYFKRFYGYPLSDQEVSAILNPSREAASGA